jgi:ketosteroid isomerase-like protein
MWISGREGQPVEVEMLDIFEVDAEGRVVAVILFDPDDRAAASTELIERYLTSGADGMSPALIEFRSALNAHDLGRARAALHDDFVLDDHRLARLGRIEGADAYIAAMAAAYELSADLSIHPLYVAATAPHGRVMVMRAAGTNTEGGEFEILYAALIAHRGEKIAMIEFFEPEDLDAALARFEELRPDPKHRTLQEART